VGWQFCDGQLLSIQQYNVLYALSARFMEALASQPARYRICAGAPLSVSVPAQDCQSTRSARMAGPRT
jgi:hypothetical protein